MSSATYPAAIPSYGTLPTEYKKEERIARDVESICTQMGTVPATAASKLTKATAVTLTVASGSFRWFATHGIAAGMTITVSTAGATHGQDFYILKTATGGTGATTVLSESFATHKKFGCHLKLIGTAWYMVSMWEQA